jgi:hypothetical protein
MCEALWHHSVQRLVLMPPVLHCQLATMHFWQPLFLQKG